jgi:hypothetical protein
MLDTLIYYTDFLITFANAISFAFFGISLLSIIYSFFAYFIQDTASGWASMFVLLSMGFGVLFVLFSVVCKYLHHILNSQNTKAFYWSSVEKKEKK